jgi:hypothetical protein
MLTGKKPLSKKGAMQNQAVSASGGNEFVNYFISGNYANQDGFVKDWDIKLILPGPMWKCTLPKN